MRTHRHRREGKTRVAQQHPARQARHNLPLGDGTEAQDVEASAATPIALRAPDTDPPAGMIAPRSGASACAQRVKCARMASAEPAKPRSPPRTFSRDTPSEAAIGR